MDINGIIYDPVKEFKALAAEHKKIVDDKFEQFTKDGNVNVDENKKTVKLVEDLERKISKSKIRLAWQRRFRFAWFVLIGFCAFLIPVLAYSIWMERDEGSLYQGLISIGIVIAVLLITLASLMIALYHNVRIKNFAEELLEMVTKYRAEKAKAFEQAKALNALIKNGISESLFTQTIPWIKFDEYVSEKKLAFLMERYGLKLDNDKPNESVFEIKTGSIKRIPFLIVKKRVQWMSEKTYYGTLTGSTSKEGKKPKAYTVTASVTKPWPDFYDQTSVYLLSDAAPRLEFKREHAYANRMTGRSLKKYFKDNKKYFEKHKEILMQINDEFELLWNARERNNDEVGYRLLFTPSAQKGLKELLMDESVGFGDDFDFIKKLKVNQVVPAHLISKRLSINYYPEDFFYSFEKISNYFKSFNEAFFKNLYFAFAPYWSIPIFMQTLPIEEIYKGVFDTKKDHLANVQYEAIANSLPNSIYATIYASKTKTPCIIKILNAVNENGLTSVATKTYGFDYKIETEWVNAMTPDGTPAQVPVEWKNYFTVHKESSFSVVVPENNLDNKREWLDKFNKDFANNWKDVEYNGILLAEKGLIKE